MTITDFGNYVAGKRAALAKGSEAGDGIGIMESACGMPAAR